MIEREKVRYEVNIEIKITEEEITGMIRDCVKETIQQSVNIYFDKELGRGYVNFMDELADRAIEKIPEHFESEREYLINKTADKLAKALKVSNTEIIQALLSLSESEEK